MAEQGQGSRERHDVPLPEASQAYQVLSKVQLAVVAQSLPGQDILVPFCYRSFCRYQTFHLIFEIKSIHLGNPHSRLSLNRANRPTGYRSHPPVIHMYITIMQGMAVCQRHSLRLRERS